MIDVAVDARVTRRMSVGTRTYLRELLARLPTAAPDVRVTPVGNGENFWFDEQVRLPSAIARSGAQLVHFPTTFAPLVRPLPYVVTIHDLIHLRYPALFGRATAIHYRLVGIPLARGAARLCVGDERTIDDCERYLGVPRERCRVAALGYDPALLVDEEPLETNRPFLFYAGNHRPHKNLETLFAAWAALPASRDVDLRVTGPVQPGALARFTRRNGQLIFTGDLSARDLRRHYRAALAYVHPALCEGFGIPMLEAAVVGTPVIASTGAVPGIVAPFAATFEARDGAALGALLEAAIREPGAFRRRAAEGVVPLRAYTWHRFAAATAAVYREVVECP